MRWAVLTLLVVLHASGAAYASEESRKLTARGLFLLQSGFEGDALDVFEKAVVADDKDVDAHYYRGMLRGNRGDLATSIADLRMVMAARPDFHQAALELGVGLVQAGAYAESIPWLEQAQRVTSLESKASLYLGLAQLRMQDQEKAQRNFERVSSADPKLAQAAQYYLGMIAYQQNRWEDARAKFTGVAAQQTGSAFEREAAAFLETIESRDYVPYRLRAAVGFEYDTNVVLAPDDQALQDLAGVGNEADGRFSLGAGGTYVWRLDPVRVSVGYDFYQSLHFDLHEFNLQDHQPAIEITSNLGPVQLGLLGEYNYYLRETTSFLQEGSVLPWIAVNAGEWGRTELSYRMRRRDFLEDQFAIRDAFNHAGAARQVFFLGAPERYLSIGYRFDADDPVHSDPTQTGSTATAGPSAFAYFANEVSGGIGWLLPFDITAEANYAFRHERYRRESDVYVCTSDCQPGQGDARRDNEQDIFVALSRPLSEILSVSVSYSGTINNSNAQAFEYDRHITSLALQARW